MDSPNITLKLSKHILLILLILNSGIFFSHMLTTPDIHPTLPIESNERQSDPVQALTIPTKSVTTVNQIENENISLYSLDYYLFDSDQDGYGDWVSIIFDPDLPEGIVGIIDCEVLLKTASDVTVANISDSCYLNGDDYDEFATIFQSISDYGYGNGSYYVQLLLYHQLNPIPKCINNTEMFDLTEITITASFKSVSVNVIDTFNDGIDDEIIVRFDPDLSAAIEGEVLVEIYLINAVTLEISFTDRTYTIFYNTAQIIEVSIGGNYPESKYYFRLYIYYHSTLEHDTALNSADFYYDNTPPTIPNTNPDPNSDPQSRPSSTTETNQIDTGEIVDFFTILTFLGFILLFILWRLFK